MSAASLTVRIAKPAGLKRNYRFTAEDKELAILNYPKPYGGMAIAGIQEKQWKFSRKGFWKHAVEINAEHSPYTKDNVRFNWRYKIIIKGLDDRPYLFRQTNCWKNSWSWFDEDKKPLMEIKSNMWSNQRRGNISFHQPFQQSFLWLMLLGWFIVIAYEDDASMMSAVA